MSITNLLVLCLASGGIGAVIAQAKKQNPIIGLFLGAVLGPLGWLLMAVSSPDTNKSRPCPSCLEVVPSAAVACSHCGRDLPPAAKRASSFRLTK